MVKVTTEQYISRAKAVHGEKYDYTNTIFTGCKNKVEIICSQHGKFQQFPYSHLDGQGCRKCGGRSPREFSELCIEFNHFHKDKFDYSQADYKNLSTKISIVCPEHGIFKQTPVAHLSQSCPKCAAKTKAMTLEQFLIKAKAVHGEKYDYTNVAFDRQSDKIEVICLQHGSFFPIVANFIYKKTTCPKCSKCGVYSARYFTKEHNKRKTGTLYIFEIKTPAEHFIKIGISINIKNRTTKLKSVYPTATIVYKKDGKLHDMFKAEQHIIQKYVKFKYLPDISFGGKNECLQGNIKNIVLEDIHAIQSPRCSTLVVHKDEQRYGYALPTQT